MVGSLITWKNTSSDSTTFLATALANSFASVFFAPSICWTVNPLKNLSVFQMAARYLSNVSSLTMHFFSILLATTLESIFRVQHYTPIAHNFQKPSSIASYSTMLLLHLSASAVNCSCTAYFNLIPECDFSITTAHGPKTP
jgi:hypothetical protein